MTNIEWINEKVAIAVKNGMVADGCGPWLKSLLELAVIRGSQGDV